MNTTRIVRILPVVSGMLAIIAGAFLPTAGRAEGPQAKCRVCVAQESAVPVLGKIPYLGRFFKNVPHQEVEQIGVDFDFAISPDCPRACKAGVAAGVCQSTPRPQLFVIRKTASGQAVATCCKDEPCCGKECEAATACCEKGCEIICEEEDCEGLSWERIIKLTAKNAALEAVLEARESFAGEKTEFLEMLAELSMEKVALEGKVAAMAQKAELTQGLLALATENGRLKAQVELAEAKLALVQDMAKLAIENEQLKLAARSRSVPAQLSNDVEYLPPGPHTHQPVRSSPAKKATFQDEEPLLGEPEAKHAR